MKSDVCHIRHKVSTQSGLETRPGAVKLTGGNTGWKLLDTGLHNTFLDMTLRVQTTRAKNKWDHAKRKGFCPVKEAINKMSGQSMDREKVFIHCISEKEWFMDREKIFEDCISEKEWLPKIYKEPIQLNSKNKNRHKTNKKQQNNPIENWANGLNWHFSRKDIQMANSYMKRCSISPILEKCKLKLQWGIFWPVFTHSLVFDPLRPSGLQHTRLPCPLSPAACSNACPLSQRCHATISSFVSPSSLAFNLSQHQGLF